MIDQNARITFTAPAVVTDKVAAIKAVRTLTGLGLKDAKDACERPGETQTFLVNAGYFNTQSSQPTRLFEEQVRILRNQGFQVGESVHVILDDLRKLGAQALEQGEDELANEILQLVLAEKLRRNASGN